MKTLIILFFLKILIIKIFKFFKFKISNLHILSTFIPLIIIFVYFFYNFKMDNNLLLIISLIFIVYSYIFVNIPGAYVTSIRLKILEIIDNNNYNYFNFNKKFNDIYLFEDRFDRIIKYNITSENNGKYNIISLKIIFLIKFVNFSKMIFSILNKY